MLPAQLQKESFARYPPEARGLAVASLGVLRELPLAFLPSFLRELIEYDTRFPAERVAIEGQLRFLGAMSTGELAECFAGFARVTLPTSLAATDWVNRPLLFTEQMAAVLWSTGQMEGFRAAAAQYGTRLDAALKPEAPAVPRLGIAVIGRGATGTGEAVFAKLRPQGTTFTKLDATDGLAEVLAAVEARAKARPAAYAHWYVDGGEPEAHTAAVTGVAYGKLAGVRDALLARIEMETRKPGMGPEELRNVIAGLQPAEFGLRGDPVLDRFQVQLLTEGSGTQIFATTFAQWASREVLRRAEAETLLVRYAPRQRQRPMNELLASGGGTVELDPEGSLVDGEMGSYLQWINQQRLPGAARGMFLAWWEGRGQAVAISPTLPRGASSGSGLTLGQVLRTMES